MPICQFFVRNSCTRKKCPFVHKKSNVLLMKRKRKSSRVCTHVGSFLFLMPILPNCTHMAIEITKKKITLTAIDFASYYEKMHIYIFFQQSIGSSQESNASQPQINQPTQKNAVAKRYFTIEPESQPTVSIIPRRLPPDLQDVDKKMSNGAMELNSASAPKLGDVNASSNSVCDSSSATSTGTSANDLRRQRLLAKVSALKSRVRVSKQENKCKLPPSYVPL